MLPVLGKYVTNVSLVPTSWLSLKPRLSAFVSLSSPGCELARFFYFLLSHQLHLISEAEPNESKGKPSGVRLTFLF